MFSGGFGLNDTTEEKIRKVGSMITSNVLSGITKYDYDAPEFLKREHPEIFLPEDAPQDMQYQFYKGSLSFEMIREYPEYRKILAEKNLKMAFPRMYERLFSVFDMETILKLGPQYPETMKMIAMNNEEENLKSWYKATGGRFIPHYAVILHFPVNEIDSFLRNGKKWSRLMSLEKYKNNDDGKRDILKAAYALGVFQGNDDSFNKVMELFSGVPNKLTEQEYIYIEQYWAMYPNATFSDITQDKNLHEKTNIVNWLKNIYVKNQEGEYTLKIDKQKEKRTTKQIRRVLEEADFPGILTPIKAHQIFDSFIVKYDPEFEKFFYENVKEIISSEENMQDIATIQRQFKEITRVNSGRKVTLNIAKNYIQNIGYTDIDIGNENLAEQVKIAGYSQKDFERVQQIYNEGKTRGFSSIPRIKGKTEKYTYEMLRCDDPLAITIGTLTDCCQAIHGAGQTSMEHSVVSPDGRVFCVKDEQGRIVAQSWFWRNQYTGCFDNIEIPNRVFKTFHNENPTKDRTELTNAILEVYKIAAQDLMKEDKKVYDELLQNKTITKEQYNALLLGKITIGLGYNDIADAIKADTTIQQDQEKMEVKPTKRFPKVYTDAKEQYIIAERDGIIKNKQENLYIYQDDIPVYDKNNMTDVLLLSMKRMEVAKHRDKLALVTGSASYSKIPKSQKIINEIAKEYQMQSENTQIMATPQMAIIYNKHDGKLDIGDILSAPIKEDLTEEQKRKAEKCILAQMKKAIKQMDYKEQEINISRLNEEQTQLWQNAVQEIEKEENQRGER